MQIIRFSKQKRQREIKKSREIAYTKTSLNPKDGRKKI